MEFFPFFSTKLNIITWRVTQTNEIIGPLLRKSQQKECDRPDLWGRPSYFTFVYFFSPGRRLFT